MLAPTIIIVHRAKPTSNAHRNAYAQHLVFKPITNLPPFKEKHLLPYLHTCKQTCRILSPFLLNFKQPCTCNLQVLMNNATSLLLLVPSGPSTHTSLFVSVLQAAALGGQLIAHCRREAELGLVTPQELLQSAQRQRCYLGYIPQPPQVLLPAQVAPTCTSPGSSSCFCTQGGERRSDACKGVGISIVNSDVESST